MSIVRSMYKWALFMGILCILLFNYSISNAAEKIAFSQISSNGDYDIWMVNPEDRNDLQRLTNTPSIDEMTPILSPSGDSIAYIDYTNNRLMLMDIITGESKVLYNRNIPYISYPAWSPNGTEICYMEGTYNNYDIWVYNLTDQTRRKLTSSGIDWSSCWSPDGSKIAYTGYDNSNIYTMNSSDGSNKTSLNTGYQSDYPAWSPDGNKILYMRSQGVAQRDIWIMDYNGNNKTPFIESPQNEYAPQWSPSGDKFVFMRDDDLYTINYVTKEEYRLTFTHNNQMGNWGNVRLGDAVVLQGVVVARDSHGDPLNPLSDANVGITYGKTITTDSQGEFRFENLRPGTYTVTASKNGYYSDTKQVTLAAGDIKKEVFYLTAQQADEPIAYNFKSPNGRHFIEGMPGNLSFESTVAWNGTPGTVRFLVADQWVNATTTDLGGGLAKATLTIAAPSIIDSCSELKVEVVSGEGKVTRIDLGVHFSPIFGIIPWYSDNISWTPSGMSLLYSEEKSWDWDLLNKGDVGFNAFLGYGWQIKYDLLSATLGGSLNGSGGLSFKLPTPHPKIKVLGEGAIELEGALDISMAGCNPPKVTPSWSFGFSSKAGIEAPAVLLLDFVAPGVGSTLAQIPIVDDIKLQLYILLDGSRTGEYDGISFGPCLLGSTSYYGSITGGLEAQARLELTDDIAAGVYVGGTGTFDLEMCPTTSWQSFTGYLYAGAFAEAYGFTKKIEKGAEFEWDFTGESIDNTMSALSSMRYAQGVSWEPIGMIPLKWGNVNQLIGDGSTFRRKMKQLEQTGGFAEERIVENVIGLARPSLLIDESRTIILFALHDTDKPWYAATDIGEVIQDGTAPWTLERVTNDQSAEFMPQIIKLDDNTLMAVWTRVEGDVSQAQGPEDIAPRLEIVASMYDRSSCAWSEPAQITVNDTVDRDPLPVLFGSIRGVLWVQNQGQVMMGNAEYGDSLMFRAWNGTDWSAPVTLWSGQKGIPDFSFTADAQGQGHVVLAVDEDGNTATQEDRELYRISTQGGVWQEAAKVTDDSAKDALPVLIALENGPMLIWKSADELMYTSLLTWNPREVFAEYTPANEAPTLDGKSMPGGAAIAYTVQSQSGIDIVAAFYDAALDQWSLPRQLTRDEHAESSLSMDFDDDELVIAYLKTQTLREDKEIEINGKTQIVQNVPQPGRTDLYILRHSVGNDMAVTAESIVLNPANPAPGTSANIKATIQNNGDLPVQNVAVAFYNGNPTEGGVLIGDTNIPGPLVAGSSQETTVVWDIPAALNVYNIYVVVDPMLAIEDLDRTNNTAFVRTSLPDLAVETAWSDPISNNTLSLTAKVKNNGVIPSGSFDVVWRQNGVDGEEIGRTNVESVIPGAVNDVSVLWNVVAPIQPGKFIPIYVVVDPVNAVLEFNETNNTAMQSIKTPMYTDQVGTLTVNITPDEAVTAGVRWSLDGGVTWYYSGTQTTVLAGIYSVIFNEVEGWSFAGWSGGDCSDTGTCTVPMGGANTVTASFNLTQFSVTATSGSHGAIACDPNPVDYGQSSTCTAAPDSGYEVEEVTVDGNPAALTNNQYIFSNVTVNHSIHVTFKPLQFTITASSGSHGAIACVPNPVDYGSSSTCTAIPDNCYEVDAATVDENPATLTNNQYVFSNVTANHSIHVTFKPIQFTITATSGPHGSISCVPNPVNCGSSSTCTATPDSGYQVDTATVDGSPATLTNNQHIFGNVTANHSIHVTFADTTPPTMAITSHTSGQVVNSSPITLAGTASDSGRGDNGIQQVTVNGSRANNDTAADGGTANWSREVSLLQCENPFTVEAYDNSLNHNKASQAITLTYPNQCPVHGSRTHGGYYCQGSNVEVTVRITYEDTLTALGVEEEIPANWSYVSVGGQNTPPVAPQPDATGKLPFAWIQVPASPVEFKYTVRTPDNAADLATFTGDVIYRKAGPEMRVSILDTSMEKRCYHCADYNPANWKVNLSELLRVIQFFNVGAYHCDPQGEDGYAPGAGDHTCRVHHSDYNPQDWKINLSELLRLIQFFNVGGYHPDPLGEDGFAPGLQ